MPEYEYHPACSEAERITMDEAWRRTTRGEWIAEKSFVRVIPASPREKQRAFADEGLCAQRGGLVGESMAAADAEFLAMAQHMVPKLLSDLDMNDAYRRVMQRRLIDIFGKVDVAFCSDAELMQAIHAFVSKKFLPITHIATDDRDLVVAVGIDGDNGNVQLKVIESGGFILSLSPGAARNVAKSMVDIADQLDRKETP